MKSCYIFFLCVKIGKKAVLTYCKVICWQIDGTEPSKPQGIWIIL